MVNRPNAVQELPNVVVDEKLIKAVRKYPCLWGLALPTFKDRTAKANSWKKVIEEVSALLSLREASKSIDLLAPLTFTENTNIAFKMQLMLEDMQKKWKNLCNSFVRELRKCKHKSGDPAPPPTKV